MRASRPILGLCILLGTACEDQTQPAATHSMWNPPRPPAPEVPAALDENSLESAVIGKLLSDDAIPIEALTIEANLSVVTLEGTVPNLLAKERAVRLARLVRGVRAITDHIVVAPSTVPDRRLAADVEAALRLDPVTEPLDVEVGVHDQAVTLAGRVDAYAQAMLVERTAKSIRGVRAVKNELDVRTTQERSDPEVSADILARMRWDALLDARMVAVEVSDGAVTLRGTVGSDAERWRALADAWLPGVRSVAIEQLEVRDEASDAILVQPSDPAPTDAERIEALRLALALEPRVNGALVSVRVHDGVATLRGTVANLAAREAAVALARNTVGIREVVDALEVRGEFVDDEAIERDLGQLVALDPLLDDAHIGATVKDGRVTLSGTVRTFAARAEARDIAARTAGVRDVDNAIEVPQPKTRPFVSAALVAPYHPVGRELWGTVYVGDATTSSLPDATLERQVEQAIANSPFLDARDIEVSVDTGRVRLGGEVDTIAQRDEALKSAYEGGARNVDDALVIRWG